MTAGIGNHVAFRGKYGLLGSLQYEMEGSMYTSCDYKMCSFKVFLAKWRVSAGVELSED